MREAEKISGFPPVAAPDARILVLGSMPSVESLKQSFYYAHPRNAFWPIMARILGAKQPETIDEKKNLLLKNRIALWDTVGFCIRSGSLDSAIRCAEPNDFAALYRCCPQIAAVFFNGAAAENLYRRLVDAGTGGMSCQMLPSTSPAYTLSFEKKLEIWSEAFKKELIK